MSESRLEEYRKLKKREAELYQDLSFTALGHSQGLRIEFSPASGPTLPVKITVEDRKTFAELGSVSLEQPEAEELYTKLGRMLGKEPVGPDKATFQGVSVDDVRELWIALLMDKGHDPVANWTPKERAACDVLPNALERDEKEGRWRWSTNVGAVQKAVELVLEARRNGGLK